ncbi:MAG: MoaD/ThiS family protein [Anaerolineales bacterium]|nr:MoaD/ThiS family protein [Anaerolineales bacterium]
MPKIKFLGNLKRHIPDGEITLTSGLSLTESLRIIANMHQSLKEILFTPDTDELRDTYLLVVNGELVRFLEEGSGIILKTDDIVQIFPPISGG